MKHCRIILLGVTNPCDEIFTSLDYPYYLPAHFVLSLAWYRAVAVSRHDMLLIQKDIIKAVGQELVNNLVNGVRGENLTQLASFYAVKLYKISVLVFLVG